MKRLYVFNGALAVIGLSLGVPAAYSLLAGDDSLPTLLMAVGGAGTVLGAGYGVLRTDPEEFTASTPALFALVAAAGLALLGTALSALSGG